MNDLQRKRQRQVIAIEYGRMFHAGLIPALDIDCDESRHLWATQALGRLISTLKACEDCELNVLRDVLNGKPPKVHTRLQAILWNTKHNPDAWVDHMVRLPKLRLSRFLDPLCVRYTVQTLPYAAAYALLKLVDVRERHNSVRSGRSANRVSEEQATLWGGL